MVPTQMGPQRRGGRRQLHCLASERRPRIAGTDRVALSRYAHGALLRSVGEQRAMPWLQPPVELFIFQFWMRVEVKDLDEVSSFLT